MTGSFDPSSSTTAAVPAASSSTSVITSKGGPSTWMGMRCSPSTTKGIPPSSTRWAFR